MPNLDAVIRVTHLQVPAGVLVVVLPAPDFMFVLPFGTYISLLPAGVFITKLAADDEFILMFALSVTVTAPF